LKLIFSIPARLIVLLLLTCLSYVAETRAQGGHGHQSTDGELGRVDFPISCGSRSQTQFNRAVAWIHSFEYEEAEKAFTEITIADPKCGIAFWGIAMSIYHPIWAPPSAAELQKGGGALRKAKSAGANTQREREYITAMEVFYEKSESLDHRARALAFSEAMAGLHRRYPTDNEAAAFYALTLVAKGMATGDKTYTNEKKAAEILNRILAVEPRHPGVTHYLIHGYDFPALAHLALPAARRYAKIAPASAHAQHMPSHIFTRLGLWQESILSNIDAKASARAYAERHKMPGAWDEQLHAMDYLVYAYLQGAQDKQARAILDELAKIRRVDPPNFKVAYSITAIPARYALERRRWSEAARMPMPAAIEGLQWQNFEWAEAHIHFARAIGAARTGDANQVREPVEKLKIIRQNLAELKGDYDWGKQVEIESQVASAWLAFTEGKHHESIKLMRLAAELDEATEKHAVTPGSILPAREQLGELLLEANQPAAALKEFEQALRTTPNRFNAVYGAARSARSLGDQKKATTYYQALVELCRLADDMRPEIREAKNFLTTKTPRRNSLPLRPTPDTPRRGVRRSW
jgi:tetratricopeptide (TPR) repeat protein